MITPFADDEAASSIGSLTIENGTARVLISGSVEITRDDAGLKKARELKRLADDLVARLEAGRSSEGASATNAATDHVGNPFA